MLYQPAPKTNPSQPTITIDCTRLKNINIFKYLASITCNDAYLDKEIASRISEGSHEAVERTAVSHEAVEKTAVSHEAVKKTVVSHEAVERTAVSHEAVERTAVSRVLNKHNICLQNWKCCTVCAVQCCAVQCVLYSVVVLTSLYGCDSWTLYSRQIMRLQQFQIHLLSYEFIGWIVSPTAKSLGKKTPASKLCFFRMTITVWDITVWDITVWDMLSEGTIRAYGPRYLFYGELLLAKKFNVVPKVVQRQYLSKPSVVQHSTQIKRWLTWLQNNIKRYEPAVVSIATTAPYQTITK